MIAMGRKGQTQRSKGRCVTYHENGDCQFDDSTERPSSLIRSDQALLHSDTPPLFHARRDVVINANRKTYSDCPALERQRQKGTFSANSGECASATPVS
jgi:hypothetical protein